MNLRTRTLAALAGSAIIAAACTTATPSGGAAAGGLDGALVKRADIKIEIVTHGQAQDDEYLGVSGVRRSIGRAGTDDQLLPQPLGMLACELARQRVEAAHALDRDQEGLFSGQASLGQRRQLVAQMSLELLDVGTVKGLPAAQILPPLRDLLLERLIGEGRHTVHAFIQIPRRVPSTACHCCRWAASCARPSLVIR